MITGFNTDVPYDGVTYHVQTEDKGLETPLILSLVSAGAIFLFVASVLTITFGGFRQRMIRRDGDDRGERDGRVRRVRARRPPGRPAG